MTCMRGSSYFFFRGQLEVALVGKGMGCAGVGCGGSTEVCSHFPNILNSHLLGSQHSNYHTSDLPVFLYTA